MTTTSSLLDLDDADALIAADSEGALRSAALAGAQVRATTTDALESMSGRLTDLRPRSVVFVSGHGRGSRAAALLVASIGSRIGIPLVQVAATPPWVGPLDVVVVSGDDAGDPRLAESVGGAVGRGAEVVLVAPDEGPLMSAAAGRAVVLPPRIAVREYNSLMRHLAADMAVLASIDGGALRSRLPDPDRLADLVDGEALRAHPSHEVFHNPAKSLATRMTGRRVVLSGEGPAGVELARHGVEVLLRSAGLVASAAELTDVVAAAVRSRHSAPPSNFDPFFHDTELDGPLPEAPMRVFVAATDAAHPLVELRIAAVPDAEAMLADSGGVDSGSLFADGPARGVVPVPVADPLGELETMSVLATRLEMAAAYLSLMGGG